MKTILFYSIVFACALASEAKVLGFHKTAVVDGVTWSYFETGKGASIECSDNTPVIPKTTTGEVVIPSELGGLPVVAIGCNAFRDCKLLSAVSIPSSVEKIETGAFLGCSGLGDGVVVIDGCAIVVNGSCPTHVELPIGTRLIAANMFSYCNDIKEIAIPPTVENVGKLAFYNCSGLSAVRISDLASWCRINFEDADANPLKCAKRLFLGDKEVLELNIPDAVDRINNFAFYNCNGLTSISIPKSVESIGIDAFMGCSKLGQSIMTIDGCVFATSNGRYLYVPEFTIPPDTRVIAGGAFSGLTDLSAIEIPQGVISIGEKAFSGCSSLKRVSVPDGVVEVEKDTFAGCSSLQEVCLPESVLHIGEGAFYECKNLQSINMPKCLTSIEDRAFGGCDGLGSGVIIIDGCVVAFNGGLLPEKVVLPPSTRLIADSLINNTRILSLEMPEGMEYIGDNAFCACNNLVEVNIPSTVRRIGDFAFYGTRLTSVRVPKEVTTIGYYAFPAKCEIVPKRVVVRVDGNSKQKTYDGVCEVQSFSIGTSDPTFQERYLRADEIKTLADVGVYRVGAEEFKIENTNDDYVASFQYGADAVVEVLPRFVTLVSRSASKIFDGTPLSVVDIVLGGLGFVGNECTVVVTGTQTSVGSSRNGVRLNWTDGALPSNYDIDVTEGILTILPAKVSNDGAEPGNTPTKVGAVSRFDTVVTYDGAGHAIDTNALMDVTLVADTPVFSYSLTSNGVFRAEPYCFTNACVTSVWYKISAANYEDYVHEARVTILPREVTLTSGEAQKKYDGNPLTSNELIVGGNGFVGDDGVTWTCTGSQTEVGSSENTFEYAFKDGTLASNYSIVKRYGTLTVEYAGVTDAPTVLTEAFSGDCGEVVIACKEAGDVVYYTLDGSAPTTTSAVYAGPIPVAASDAAICVRAIAVRKGWAPSEVATQQVVSLTPPDGSGNAVTNAEAVCHADNAGVLDITYDVAGNSSSNRQRVEVVVSVCGTNLTYVVADGSVSVLGAAGRHTVTVDFSSVLNAAKGYSYVVKVGGSSVEVPNWAEDKEGLLVKDNWAYGHTDGTIRELEMPDGVVGIAAGAFAGFAQLETVSLPLTLRQICANAFTMDTHLTSIVLPEGLESVGDEAFYGCTKMSNVIVPGTVKRVGEKAFAMCTALTYAQVAYGVESIGAGCFSNDWRISEVDLPSTVTNIGKEAFGGDSSIIRAGLRCDVRKMSEIFSNYQHIREIIVKEGDGEIVDGCFKDCEELKDVRYMGNCPALEKEGRELYANTFVSNTLTLVSYVLPESTGWDGIESSDQLPQAWPLVGGYRRPIAHWDVPTYLCRFDSNGGTLGVQDTYQYSEQDVVLPPEPVQSGYKFAGWWTQPVGGLRVTEKTIFIEGVYTYLWAHWVKGHTVFLDPNGGVVINGFVTYVDESVYGVLPTPVRSGYAFDGWLYNNEKIRPDTKINEMADHTLTAQWTANQYKVQYHPNGGTGDLVVEEWVYGETNCLRRNAFVREGYVFIGWATEEGSDEVVYRDCEPVANLTTEDGAVVELWAVWQESDAVDPTNVELSFGGEANWEKVYELVSTQMEGHVVCTPSFWRSGKIADNEQSDMRTEVFGAGTIGFWWKVSCEKFRQEKLDHLSFAIDDVEQTWINGETDWAYVEFRVDEVTAHEFVWRYEKDWMDFDGDDRGSVCAVVWTPRLETLEDYAGTTNLTLVTSGDAEWFGVTNVAHNQSGSVRSGKIVDGQESRLEALVEGEGVVEFWWKTDCERFRDYKIDRVAFYVDGSELVWTNGVIDWQHQRFKVSGAGTHTLSWVYIKDDEGTVGEDCAWVSEINWIPAGAKMAVPSVVGDEGATVTGDAETGFVVKPSEGKTAVEVSIPQGVDAAKVTVEVSPKVTSMKPNGAKVKIVSGGADITEFLNVPAADGNGVVDLTKATVKEEIVKEAMDPAKGAEIKLDASNPKLMTPNTRVGLFYLLREGATLEGMKDGDSTIGDGKPWSPKITVKGGNSAFYAIGVGKGE